MIDVYFLDRRKPGTEEWIEMVPADSERAAKTELRHWARRGWEVRWGWQGEHLPLPEEVTTIVAATAHPQEPSYLVERLTSSGWVPCIRTRSRSTAGKTLQAWQARGHRVRWTRDGELLGRVE